ncbi:hypothetical protein HJG60_009835 [Phyllostomus discolor]|uniref:Uncharacterized protein n=1 Tax=Phyllostomus discolor TaxID=89673 RepID=A0A834ELE0_9CHIR|nr:hypothetical protein HJG60_009835 [Phyllostomus discolor]
MSCMLDPIMNSSSPTSQRGLVELPAPHRAARPGEADFVPQKGLCCVRKPRAGLGDPKGRFPRGVSRAPDHPCDGARGRGARSRVSCGGGDPELRLRWPEGPGPQGRRLWLQWPRPKDLPQLGRRGGRAPMPSPSGRCPVKPAQRSDGICPRSPT